MSVLKHIGTAAANSTSPATTRFVIHYPTMRFLLSLLLTLTIFNVQAQTMITPTLAPTHSLLNPDGTYSNPTGSPKPTATWLDFQKFFWGSLLFRTVPQVPAGFVLPAAQAQTFWQQTPGDKLQWLGHSAFRMEIAGTTLLTDPYLTARASPFQWAGPKRFTPSPITPQEARADLILLTHNHYDHLDMETLKNLPNKDSVHVLVPLGVGPLVRSAGIAQVQELDWNQSIRFGHLTITLVPAVHFSARWISDRNTTLWGGYVIKSPNLTVYQTGDTTYHPTVFKQIGQQYGPMDYALVPIGAYEPRNIMVGSHTTPEESLEIARDVHATKVFGHHWGTVQLTTEPPFQPPVRFLNAARAAGLAPSNTLLFNIGETRQLIPAN